MQGSLMLDVEGTWLTAEDRDILRQPQVGGVILFSRNIEHPQQVRELCRSMRRARPDLLIAVDQEGGRVQRLRRGFTRLPSMRRIAASGNPQETARQAGWLMAAEVLAAGIDFSFAPVLDLDYGHNSVVTCRSFGREPKQVVELGGAFMRGMQQAGMATVGKHFPGHGWVTADSHFAIPVDERDLESIRKSDMQVFAGLVAHMDGIMPAHVIYRQVDEQPAGFSRFWLQDVLRNELGFNGIIFSDDLSMAGAHVAGDIRARCLAAIGAGCDMVLVCNDRAAARQALTCLQENGITPAAGLQVMRARQRLYAGYGDRPASLAIRQQLQALERSVADRD